MNPSRTSIRIQRILDLVATQAEVAGADLAQRFGVTPMTIRRDLETLEERGEIVRTHGGAMRAAPAVARFAFNKRRQTRIAEKRAIAAAAAQRVAPGMNVILDTGTTTLEIARHLTGVAELRVLTSSLAVASRLFAHENIELILLGGTVRRGSPDLTGRLTEGNLQSYRTDIAFIGADAVDPDGLYTDSESIAQVSRAMIASSKQTVLVADSSKFGRTAFAKFASWPDVDATVVDETVNDRHRQWLDTATNDVVYAPRGAA